MSRYSRTHESIETYKCSWCQRYANYFLNKTQNNSGFVLKNIHYSTFVAATIVFKQVFENNYIFLRPYIDKLDKYYHFCEIAEELLCHRCFNEVKSQENCLFCFHFISCKTL